MHALWFWGPCVIFIIPGNTHAHRKKIFFSGRNYPNVNSTTEDTIIVFFAVVSLTSERALDTQQDLN